MNIILTGGGTAGHINPALAIADYVSAQDKNANILYVGAKGRMEEKLVKLAGYNFKSIEISGFSRNFNLDGIKNNCNTIKLLFKSIGEAKKILKEFKPDICIGTGGYVSWPIIHQAQRFGIANIIHEQNAFPGITTKMLASKADCVMLAIDYSKKYLKSKCNIEITGNPVRAEVLNISYSAARKELKLDERPVILSFGGSLGARKINEAVSDLIVESCKHNKYQHIHAYGQFSKDFPEILLKKGIDISQHKDLDIREYINDMPRCMAAADLVISRAGAITISELQNMAKLVLFIPSPYVAENHQYHNAMALVNENAAFILEEKDLNSKTLIKKVESIFSDKNKMSIYKKNIAKMAIPDANERIYEIIKRVVAKTK